MIRGGAAASIAGCNTVHSQIVAHYFQNRRFKLAECKTEATISRAFVDPCTDKPIPGALSAEQASMAKWWCTQKQCDIVDGCLQQHGGYG